MLKKFCLVLCFSTLLFASSSTFSNPQPTFDNPRKVVYSLNSGNEDIVNSTIGSMYNILKEYPSESLKLVVVVYGKALRNFKNDSSQAFLDRVKSLMQYDVEFIACKNTMNTMNWKESDFIDGMNFTQAGIVEIIERQVDGYIPIIAY